MENTGKMVICPNCGAEFDVSLVRCPYCDAGYAPAEEEEYMGQLEEIRKDLEGHKNDGDKALKKGLGTVARYVLVSAVVIALLLFAIMWITGSIEKSRADRRKEEFLLNQGVTMQQEDSTK